MVLYKSFHGYSVPVMSQNPYVFAPPPVPALPVADTNLLFPVRRIFCVGRNYAAHAREMGANPDREPPFFFTKPADALVPGGGPVPYPTATSDLHHEVELVVALHRGGQNVSMTEARDMIYGYCVGIDLTRRDLQAQAKKEGKPWDMAKGFDFSAPCSLLVPAERIGHPERGAITLDVNGETRQRGDLSDMIWNVPETVAALSRLVHLAPGDLIFTGTPEGVGAVISGDHLTARIANVGELHIHIEHPSHKVP